MADVKQKALLFDHMKQEIKDGNVNLTLRKAEYSTNNKHQRCNCAHDCGGTWLYPNPTSVEEHLKVDSSWIPCVALITRFQEKSKSRRGRYDRLQGLFAAYGKDVKKTKERDADVHERVVSHLVERLTNYHAARNSLRWEFLFPRNHYGRVHSSEEPRPETDRREAGANVPITSLMEQTERNFVKAEYSADDEEEVSSIRPSHSGAGEGSVTQRDDRERAHSSWMDFFRRRENTEYVDYSSFITMPDVKEKALLFDALKQEIKDGSVNLTLRKTEYSISNKHQRCNCAHDCGGTWRYASPTSVEEHLKVDNSWIPCVALIKRFQEKSRSRRERYDRLQGLFAAYGKDIKKTKKRDADVNERVVSHLVERRINYDAARYSGKIPLIRPNYLENNHFGAWWDLLFPKNDYGRAHSSVKTRPEIDRREAGANVPIISLLEENDRNFEEAEYSADDDEVSSIRSSHSGASEDSFISPAEENARNFGDAHYSADDEEVSFLRPHNFETDHSGMYEDPLHQRIDNETSHSVRENILCWRGKSEEPCPEADENSLYQDNDSETACLKDKSRNETSFFLRTVIILLFLAMVVSIFLPEFLT